MKIASETRTVFYSGKTLTKEFRLKQLKQLKKMVSENKKFFTQAIQKHLGRSSHEINLSEFAICLHEIQEQIDDLSENMRPKKQSKGLMYMGATSLEIIPQPLGVALIISPWNFPLNLTLNPLAGAIAAGCCAVVKPSEISDSVARVYRELFKRYLDPQCYKVSINNFSQF